MKYGFWALAIVCWSMPLCGVMQESPGMAAVRGELDILQDAYSAGVQGTFPEESTAREAITEKVNETAAALRRAIEKVRSKECCSDIRGKWDNHHQVHCLKHYGPLSEILSKAAALINGIPKHEKCHAEFAQPLMKVLTDLTPSQSLLCTADGAAEAWMWALHLGDSGSRGGKEKTEKVVETLLRNVPRDKDTSVPNTNTSLRGLIRQYASPALREELLPIPFKTRLKNSALRVGGSRYTFWALVLSALATANYRYGFGFGKKSPSLRVQLKQATMQHDSRLATLVAVVSAWNESLGNILQDKGVRAGALTQLRKQTGRPAPVDDALARYDEAIAKLTALEKRARRFNYLLAALGVGAAGSWYASGVKLTEE